jgi:hypothetical protein
MEEDKNKIVTLKDIYFNNDIDFKNINFNWDFNKWNNIFDNLNNLKNIDFNYPNLKHKLPTTRKSTSETATKHLKEAFNNGNLNFVLGAGISSEFGIPSWDNLLQRLLMTTIEQETDKALVLSKFFSKIFNPSSLIAGRYLEESFKDDKIKNNFEKNVRDALYETYDENAHSLIVDEIIKFCLAPGNSANLDGIITYNYDDIIETKLKGSNLDMPFESVFGQAINPDNNVLKIHHVHGFLPRNGNIGNENKITLGEFVYHEQYSNTYSWNNIVQINKFRDKTCLFIGTSLADPNIRRLLDIAKTQKKSTKFHYIFKKKTNKIWLKNSINKLIEENPEFKNDKININLKIDEAIDFLIELKNRFEEIDSESLGVKTVWIEDYDKDISEILKKIRI